MPIFSVPERKLELADGKIWSFRADQLAVYELEQLVDKSIYDFMAEITPPKNKEGEVDPEWVLPNRQATNQLAYAFSASYRDDNCTDLTYRKFLSLLPAPGRYVAFAGMIYSLLNEAFQLEGEAGVGNAEAPADDAAPSTGAPSETADTTSSEPS